MEFEKIEEKLSEFTNSINFLNKETNDLYSWVSKVKNNKKASYLMWALHFLSSGLDEITASVLFIESLVKDMKKEEKQ